MTTALTVAAERARVRRTKPKLLGSAELPDLRILAPAQASLAEIRAYVTDAALDIQVRKLEELLGTSLREAANGGAVGTSQGNLT